MKKFKRVLLLALVIGSMVFAILKLSPKPSICRDIENQDTKIQKQIETEIYTRADIDIKKHLLADNIEKGNAMITQISNDVEYLILTVEGGYTIKHDSTPKQNAWTEWAVDSTIQIKLKYQATYTIPADKLAMSMDNITVKVDYNTQDIQVKSVEIKEYNVIENRNFMGKKYTKDETIALIEMAQTRIRDMLQSNEGMINKAQKNLETHLKFIGSQFGIHSINFNNLYTEHLSSYEYKKVPNVKYGSNNKPLDINEVRYIIVHDTGNLNKGTDAEMHVNYLNNNPDAFGAHLYVDNDSVVQVMDFNKQMMAVGNNKWMNNQVVNNSNSISVEICLDNIQDEELMYRTIDNAANVIKQLKEMLPNEVQVIRHKDANLKECPKIFIEGNDLYIMSFDDFLNKLK